MPEPVSCANFESLAVLYAAGELEAPARAEVEAHARACADCAAALRREMTLAELFAAGGRIAGEGQQDVPGLLLAQCRSELNKSLDEAAARPRGWREWLRPRNWAAGFRVPVDFHPAWSVTALLLVAAVSGLAGWEGVGRVAVQPASRPVMTISAAPPVSHQELATMGIEAGPRANASPSVEAQMRTDGPVVRQASPAGTQAPRNLLPWGPIPRTRRDPPSPEIRDGFGPAGAWEMAPRSGLDGWSRRMESLWWGGVRVDPAEQQKRLMPSPPPEYPEAARRAGIEGHVTLLVRIGSDGLVEDATLLSGEPVLGRAAMQAVEQWRYAPVRIGGQPVSVLTSVTLAFELR